MIEANSVLSAAEILMLRYCLMKYYIMLLRDFSDSLRPEILEKKKPNLKWKDYCKDNQFKKLRKVYENLLHEAELKITQIYDTCHHRINDIRKINPPFSSILESEVSTAEFAGSFKEAYRASTGLAYSKLREVFK